MEENITEVKDKNLVLIEANNEVSKRIKVKMLYKIFPNRNSFVLM